MYKLKYYSLSKEERKKITEDFYKTEFGNMIKKRLDRVFIIGIMSFIVSILFFIINKNIWDIISAVSLLIASFVFIIGSFKVRIDKINNYLIKQKKK